MKKIGIIGMGVSGLGILLALSKCDPKQLANLDITCFDDTEHFGRGIPFQDDDASALINSPIDDISFDYQHMGDFKEWLEENGYETDSAYFKEIVPISATQGNNVNRLMEILKDNLEEGFQYFPEDQITDHPERFLVSEMIREKVLYLTQQEVPHSIAVVVDSMKRDEDTDKVHIRATIMVERDSQKGIVIGKKGAMLKKIGTMARRDIELMLGDKVFLETWVKVKKNWRDKKLDLADFGYNEKEY